MHSDQLRLRTIVVSGRDALETARNPADRELIQGRIVELLADLQARVALDGADPALLASIEHQRRKSWA